MNFLFFFPNEGKKKTKNLKPKEIPVLLLLLQDSSLSSNIIYQLIMPSPVLKTPTLKCLFMPKVKRENNYEHFFPLRVTKKRAVCGIQASYVTCREAVWTIPCRNKKRCLHPACFKASILRAGGAGKTWGSFRDENHL